MGEQIVKITEKTTEKPYKRGNRDTSTFAINRKHCSVSFLCADCLVVLMATKCQQSTKNKTFLFLVQKNNFFTLTFI